jgi:hypothetical protein
MTPTELDAFDSRIAAYHEAAHFVIAEWAGVRGNARIWKRDNPGRNELTWTGQFRVADANKLDRISRHRRTMIGVAGAVGDALRRDPDITPWEVTDYLTCTGFDDMSPTDFSMAGTDIVIIGDPSMKQAVSDERRLIRAAEAVVELLTGELQGRFAEIVDFLLPEPEKMAA